MEKYFCIFGGGGIRGAAYTGVLKALKELNIEITGFGGSSIGAVVAGLYTVGYTEDEMQEVFNNINFQFFTDLNLNFGKDFALSKGENFYGWVKNKIEDKFYANSDKERVPVTFRDIDKDLVIFSVDLLSSKFHEFSKAKTPDVEIAHAIRVSVGMPGLYAPVFSETEYLVDGDLLKPMPLWMASETIQKKEEKILEFRLENNENSRKISNTFDYLNAVYDSISGFASDFIIKTYGDCEKYDYIKMNIDGVSVVDFMTDKAKKLNMAKTGYDTTIDYFKNKYPLKKAKITEIYKNLYAYANKNLFYLKQNNVEEARYYSSEMLNIIFDSSYTEDVIIKKLKEYKKIFDDNFIIKKGLFGEIPSLLDSNVVLNSARDIVLYVKQKLN